MSSTPSVTSPTPVLGSDTGRVAPSKGRATPKGPSFGTVLAGARPILKGAEAVASVLPGGPLVAAAVKGTPQVMSGAAPKVGPSAGLGAGGVTIAPRVPGVGAGVGAQTPGVDPVTGATGEGDGIQSVLADSQAFNMYYLELQEQISAENRQYSALSNVLKARHDTVKNAIGNIR
ncbi:MAG: hypothetical protein ACXVEE_35145 [Polyangiales bacterium]